MPRTQTRLQPLDRLSPDATPRPQARSVLPILLALFVLSGIAGLIYEIVWYQLLQLVIGSTAISLGVLLATFMGGLCLGSLLLPRLTWRRSGQPRCAFTHISSSASRSAACSVLFGMPLVSGVYTAIGGHGCRRSCCARSSAPSACSRRRS